jgi:hypothetical protein
VDNPIWKTKEPQTTKSRHSENHIHPQVTIFHWVTSEQNYDFDADVDTKNYNHGDYNFHTEMQLLNSPLYLVHAMTPKMQGSYIFV